MLPHKNNSERFKISQIIGEGATSTVYKAFDTQTSKLVALKVFPRNSNAFQNEMRILQKVSKHEHIVELEGTSQNSLVLEHCDCNLISFLNEHELEPKGIKKIIRMVLLGVYAIHSKGIIHRDLKLGNILLKGDCVKLCDFGLSCFKEENDFEYCGTKDYLAPEITSKYGYNEKIDVYAIGIIYKILLCRKKNVKLIEIEVEEDVKDLIVKMTRGDPLERIDAFDALKHSSFEELFTKVKDFRELKEYFKDTKYGRISKFCKDDVKDWIGNSECSKEIKYTPKGGPYEITSKSQNHPSNNNIHHVIQIQFDSNNLKIIAHNSEPFSYFVVLNNIETSLSLLGHSALKHFNYLSAYFNILCDRTVKFKDSDGFFSYYKTISNLEILECKDFKAKRVGEHIEIERKREVEINTEISTEGNRESHSYTQIAETFRRFAEKCSEEFKGSPSIDRFSSQGVSICTEKLVKSTEQLVRKHLFCGGVGWSVKEGLKFTLLLIDGMKISVFIEEFAFSVNDSERKGIEEADDKTLEIIKKMICR